MIFEWLGIGCGLPVTFLAECHELEARDPSMVFYVGGFHGNRSMEDVDQELGPREPHLEDCDGCSERWVAVVSASSI
jgi:hypothetical protein